MANGTIHPAPGEIIASEWGGMVWDQSVQTFTSTADRDVQFPTPQDGAITYQEDTDTLTVRRKGVWESVRVGDTGWIDGGTGAAVFVANPTNFTLTVSKIRVVSGRATLLIQGTMKVVSVQNGSGQPGDVVNLNIGTMATPYLPAAGGADQALATAGIGRVIAGYVAAAGGVLVGAVDGGMFVVGEGISLSGTYLL